MITLSSFVHWLHERVAEIFLPSTIPSRMRHPLDRSRSLWVLSSIDAKIEAIQTSPCNQIYGEIVKGATVIDVGANIGSWAITASELAGPEGRVIAIEPIPAIFVCLNRNVMLSGSSNITCLKIGLGSRESEEGFTLFPHCCALSSRSTSRNDIDAIEATLSISRSILKQWRLGFIASTFFYRLIHSFFIRILLLSHTRQVQCKVSKLSRVIEDLSLLRVDLVKINVERDEEEVLLGIEEQHWPRIKAITVQVHDIAGRVRRIEWMLKRHYLHVRVCQEPRFVGCSLWMIEAM